MRPRLSPNRSAQPAAEPAKKRPARGVFGRLHSFAGSDILTAALVAALVIATFPPIPAHAGDILRGGAASGTRTRPSGDATPNPGADAAQAAQVRAQDRLSRTTQAVNAMRQMQAAARAAAGASTVPNGLTTGGLEPLTGQNARWTGARPAVQAGNNVTIKQTDQQALLHWKTFNVGRDTTVRFDQSAGGSESGKWIAFNRVFDPSGQPSKILGSIKADGQVYVINQNGIIFGAGSQVNARTLVASSLPINDNLIKQGLLNNRDAQFLFSTTPLSGGSDGTPPFIPPAAPTSGRYGNVLVERGATLQATGSNDGNGGRIVLVGANVENGGTISTPSGQTILAAGLQVGFAAHPGNDPSLRGLDVWIGQTGTYAGAVTNSGIIESQRGSISLNGRVVRQAGVLESTTSVDLNGRIDIRAAFGAVGNPTYDNTGGGGPIFMNQFTGLVEFAPSSVTRILPEYGSGKTIAGTSLPERSRVELLGQVVNFRQGAVLLAPNATVGIAAGTYPYKDADGNGLTLDANGVIESGLNNFFSGQSQRFLRSGGWIQMESGSMIDVSGTANAFVPLAQNIVSVQFRSAEFADSPLQRSGGLRGTPLLLDLRRSGTYNGRYWIGTPLGDATGQANLTQRTVEELTTAGGSVELAAGGAITMAAGSIIDVSGGYSTFEAGSVRTSRLIYQRRLVDISNATPDRIYDGVFDGRLTLKSQKWGISETYTMPLAPMGSHWQAQTVGGANGGSLSMQAAAIVPGGTLLGATVTGDRQLDAPPAGSRLALKFESDYQRGTNANDIAFLLESPVAPAIQFVTNVQNPAPTAFGDPSALKFETLGRSDYVKWVKSDKAFGSVALSPDLVGENGFGQIAVRNVDGPITVGAAITTAPGGGVTLEASRVEVLSPVTSRSGTLNFSAFAISPYLAQTFELDNPGGALSPAADPERGIFYLAPGQSLDVSGTVSDDRVGSSSRLMEPRLTSGGTIRIEAFSVDLAKGAFVDVSGGAAVSTAGKTRYGRGGTLSVLTGKDQTFPATIGGSLNLGAELRGYAGTQGGSLVLQARTIRIGESATGATLNLAPAFFGEGGFSSFTLRGIGGPLVAANPGGGAPGEYVPGVLVDDNTLIQPVPVSLFARTLTGSGVVLEKRILPLADRTPVSLAFEAVGSDDPFTPGLLESRGDIVLGRGSRIVAEAGASVAFKGQTVSLLGEVSAPAGSITIQGGGSFPVAAAQRPSVTFARPTVYIGPEARLSAAGTSVFKTDPFQRRIATVYDGGTISVSGNILAMSGAVLDVSGTSETVDVNPRALGTTSNSGVPRNAGLNSAPWGLRTTPVVIDSGGGTIELTGSEMLLSDAELLGAAGGPGANGGTLKIFSSRFYIDNAPLRTSADINLVVTASGNVIPVQPGETGIGRAVIGSNGNALPGMGYFAADKFAAGGFDSLDLGAKFFESGNPFPYGGNVRFEGDVSIAARGQLRIARGGIIEATGSVSLQAPYVAIGQPFRAPRHPDDTITYFYQSPGSPSPVYNFLPTPGSGRLNVSAELIDLGTLSLQRIGNAEFSATGGDIRGNGVVQIAGALTLKAGQVYTTTLGTFDLFAYDPAGSKGSITVLKSGLTPTMPLSAGGSIGLFASTIVQAGVLRAPQGRIVLGWDGVTDLDPSDDAVTPPLNRVAGSSAAVPLATSVTLAAGSSTSVAALDPASGDQLLIPYGLSPDGLAWIDPSGVNITTGGLPEKQVKVLGNSVQMSSTASIDMRGGGDLYAFRWIPGAGGSIDLTGGTPADWGSGVSYTAGARVTYKGQTWSARVGNSGQTPSAGFYWSLVPKSYAILPSLGSKYAPFADFNTSPNATQLKGEPGYVDRSLAIGQQIRIDGVPGLSRGTYTLLPARYALLPGAFLVTAADGTAAGTYSLPVGSYVTQGTISNGLDPVNPVSPLVSRFEISPYSVVRTRAEYADYTFNAFAEGAASRLQLDRIQRLPRDAGGVVFQGTAGLRLNGRVLATPGAGGLGGFADVASAAAIRIVGGSATAPAGSQVVLSSDVLSSWKLGSLLIGGTRRTLGDTSTVSVRTSDITVDTNGASLLAGDLVLVSKEKLTVKAGSVLRSTGDSATRGEGFVVQGDGTALRASGEAGATLTRTGVTGATTAIMSLASGASISGTGLVIDSTYATSLGSALDLQAGSLTLGSGQLSILFPGFSGPLAGTIVDPQLVISGALLGDVQSTDHLTLRSYRTIDLYGAGTFGSATMKSITFEGAGLRGYAQNGSSTVFQASSITFANPANVSVAAFSPDTSASLTFQAGTINLGANAFRISGYQNLALQAAGGVQSTGSGSFRTGGALSVEAPIITGQRGTSMDVQAGGALVLSRSTGKADVVAGLGAALQFTGSSVAANTDVLLPSGRLTLQALTGDVSVGGVIDVSGTSRNFYDVVRYADAGTVTLDSKQGSVRLLAGSTVSLAAAVGGGSAGILEVFSPNGEFTEGGILSGRAGQGGSSGSFVLDTKTLPSYGGLRTALENGGFTNSQTFRVRNGDILLDGVSRANRFSFSADGGSITVAGTIDASGTFGGDISLAAKDNISLLSGSLLTVAAQRFSSAGKGGTITLGAGSQFDGAVNTNARVTLGSGSKVDLGVAEMSQYVAGSYDVPYSAAFYGKFEGTLHLRAPRVGANDLGVNPLQGEISGASSILVEGYRLYDLTGSGVMNTALRNSINTDNAAFINAGETAIRTALLGGNPNAAAIDPLLIVAPGVEIINRTGDLVLGLANTTGSSSTEARSTADWDLSSWRYGSRGAPGVLTLRAQGDLVFNNTLSDGFTPVTASTTNGNSAMWLAPAQTIDTRRPINLQSWSYRLTAGADLKGADSSAVLSPEALATAQPGKGSVIVGEFYPAIPNSSESGISPGAGLTGLTSGTIRISTTTADLGTRYEVVRTGTGSIAVSAGRDVQLRNVFASIYTAGVAVPTPTKIFDAGDFVLPAIPTSAVRHPSQGNLGAVQQLTQAAWTMAGGNIDLSAGRNIGRYALYQGSIVEDTSRQLPNNWLYRRGYVDPTTGLFANNGGVDSTVIQTITDRATSTAWWVDFSNFFQGVGALGGGNIRMTARNDIVNVDAVIPTNARMPGRDPSSGLNVAPDASKLVEWGGGDLTVQTGRDLSGGIYYVQKGLGKITAGRAITTNAARSPSLGIMGSTSQPSTIVSSRTPAVYDPSTWLPTTLFAGDAWFDVKARGNILLGPVVDTFLLPQGLNNRFWYKTYFRNSSSTAGASVASFGGGVVHRFATTLPGSASPVPILSAWIANQNVFAGPQSADNASYFQPWIRVTEFDAGFFDTVASLNAPTLLSTAFAGSIEVVGSGSFAPSSSGNLELLASDRIIGLNNTGRSVINGQTVNVWAYSKLNVSDADPASLPGITSPIAYQAISGRSLGETLSGTSNALQQVNAAFAETGSYTGLAASFERQRTLHASTPVHRGTTSPVRLYSSGGDLTGLTLFSAKFARIYADRDITDTAFYIQNTDPQNISIVSAGRDILPFNENAPLRVRAGDLTLQNTIRSDLQTTVAGTATTALSGDLQISGPGALEVLAGRNLDLGTGSNFADGTGVGITSIGRSRNPFLPADGARLIALAGVTGSSGNGPALGLAGSSLKFREFISTHQSAIERFASAYQQTLGGNFASLSDEGQALVALDYFYSLLRQAGADAATGGTYDRGFAAIDELIGTSSKPGEILTRSRDIRTIAGGQITLAAPGGGLTLASDITGNPQTPPGIVTEFGGRIDILTLGNVDIGQARIFTLRGGDLTIWSSAGDIAAGNAPKTVVTAPPTRVVIDSNSAALQTDLGGLATGGGIGVLASVEGVEPGNVNLIAPAGVVDAGDAGIRATGDITIAAVAVVNAENISAGGTSVGVPSAPVAAAPNVSGLSSGSATAGAANAAAQEMTKQSQASPDEKLSTPSIITVEVIGYGGGESDTAAAQDDREGQG